LAKFHPVVREHLDTISGKHGCLLYFPQTIQNELIKLLGARMSQIIISAILKAK
jgi:hypothetical protein